MKKKITGTKEWSNHSVNCVRGCSHDCKYCYARHREVVRFKRIKEEDWPRMEVNEKAVDQYRKKLHGTVMFPTSHDITPEVLDPCLTVLGKLLFAGNRVLIVSKPHLSCVKAICEACHEYKEQILFRFTIGTMLDGVLEYWEPGAPGFAERLQSLIWAFQEGFETSVSSEPLLDVSLIGAFGMAILPFISDAWWIGKMNDIDQRVKPRFARDKAEIEAIKLINTDKIIRQVYEMYRDNPKVKWKESIKEVIGLDLVTEAGQDR